MADLFREASTGLTTALDGIAPSPTAGGLLWGTAKNTSNANIAGLFVRQSGGGFKGGAFDAGYIAITTAQEHTGFKYQVTGANVNTEVFFCSTGVAYGAPTSGYVFRHWLSNGTFSVFRATAGALSGSPIANVNIGSVGTSFTVTATSSAPGVWSFSIVGSATVSMNFTDTGGDIRNGLSAAFSALASSAYTVNELSIQGASGTAPNTPIDIVPTAQTATTMILTVTPSGSGSSVDGYELQHSADGSTGWVTSGRQVSNVFAVTHTGVSGHDRWRALAYNSNGDSAWYAETIGFLNPATGGGSVLSTVPIITSFGGGATGLVSVPENTTAVATLAATGGPITWSLTGGADVALFAVNPSTGVLTLLVGQDFESPAHAGNQLVVVYRATNGSNYDEQTLTVQITDVLEGVAPTITSFGGGTTGATSILENTTAVATLAASGSTATWAIVGGADQSFFSINPTTGALSFASAPDFEAPGDDGTNNTYLVTYRATNAWGNDEQTLTVTVQDAAEGTAASITSNGAGASASISINEGIALVVTATASGTGPFTWTKSGTDAADFTIDANSGALTFSPVSDFEGPQDADGNNVYLVTITVQGAIGGTDSQALTITVLDVIEIVDPVTAIFIVDPVSGVIQCAQGIPKRIRVVDQLSRPVLGADLSASPGAIAIGATGADGYVTWANPPTGTFTLTAWYDNSL
jgi:hypothetical protein